MFDRAHYWYFGRVLLACVILPSVLAYAVWCAGPGGTLLWVGVTVAADFAFVVLFIVAPWNRISHWLRYLAFTVLVASAWYSGRGLGGLISLAFLAATLAICKSTARVSKRSALNISFPLGQGLYCVLSGGKRLILNHHVARPSQQHAVDIIRLSWLGNRSRGIYPRECSKYNIYGALVCTPCNGTVVRVVDGLPESSPLKQNFNEPAGNHVILRCDNSDVYLALAHLQQGSLLVREGQQVRAGQPLGQVGCSGNTAEPHLHIHAKRGGTPDSLTDGEAVPLLFDGKAMIRNDTRLQSA